MSKTFVYLVYFGVYSLAILFIGKSSFGESDSISKFFVGERKIGLCRLFFTFVGTWISAATILGYTGNVYQNGVAVISMSVIPWFIGALMLYAISNRLYDNDILTIPQLIRNRYGSRGLQIASALLMSCGYVLYLVMQIKGFGIAASNLLNIDYKVAPASPADNLPELPRENRQPASPSGDKAPGVPPPPIRDPLGRKTAIARFS